MPARRFFGFVRVHVVAGAAFVVASGGLAWSAPPPIVRNPAPGVPMPPAPAGVEPAQFGGVVAAHNRARRLVGVPDLGWSDPLARTAQGWAERLRGMQCEMRHSGAAGLGENLAWASGIHLRPEDVVALWVREAQGYNPRSGMCAPGAMCGHYTQVVWRETRFVGCGMARCGDAEVWVCTYLPAGNVVGQRPYWSGMPSDR